MKLFAFKEGLKILEPYFDKPDGYHLGADHDVIYVYAGNRPIADADVVKLFKLGWHQPAGSKKCPSDPEKAPDAELIAAYDPAEGWGASV